MQGTVQASRAHTALLPWAPALIESAAEASSSMETRSAIPPASQTACSPPAPTRNERGCQVWPCLPAFVAVVAHESRGPQQGRQRVSTGVQQQAPPALAPNRMQNKRTTPTPPGQGGVARLQACAPAHTRAASGRRHSQCRTRRGGQSASHSNRAAGSARAPPSRGCRAGPS